MTVKEFQSTNNLPFYCRDSELGELLGLTSTNFKIGTCHGSWICKDKKYIIIAVVNDNPGNGHFQDVLDWFENSCRRDKYDLVFTELFNPAFKKHLIEKRGFRDYSEKNGVIKEYGDM
jgi:hypothetical protein